MFLWIWLAVASAVAYLWLRKKFSHFKERGVNYVPVRTALASTLKMFAKQEHLVESLERAYKAFPNDRFYGSYELATSVVVIRDPELVRLVGVKEFDSFTSHRSFNNDEMIFSKSLFSLKGQKWRDMRATLSPAFTGSKLRSMVPLIEECNKDLLDYLLQKISQNSDKHLDIDAHDLITRYTNDVIATSAFGIKTNSIKDRDNQFYLMGKKLSNFNVIKMFLVMFLPVISKLVKFELFPMDSINFLKHIVLTSFKDRDEKKIFRPDMIQLLLDVRKGTTVEHEQINDEKDAGFATVEESTIGKSAVKRVWDDDYLVAQAFLFFFAGFETSSVALKFVLSELAINPDVQDRLRQEIDDHYDKYNGKLEYDNINKLKYLDMVISESLRKWPPAINTDRECNRPCNLGRATDTAEKDYIIQNKEVLAIPIWSFHRDPKYYENPEKFDPERFSDENKHNIKPFTYLPFGVGPRNCIASRFALVEVKVMVCGLLRRFKVSPAPQMQIPLRLDQKSLPLRLEGGHYLRFTCRS